MTPLFFIGTLLLLGLAPDKELSESAIQAVSMTYQWGFWTAVGWDTLFFLSRSFRAP